MESANQPFVFARLAGVTHYITRTSTGWTDWTSLGAVSATGTPSGRGFLTAIRNTDGQIQLFSVLYDLFHVGQLTDSEWSEWSRFDNAPTLAPTVTEECHQLAVAQNVAGALEVFTLSLRDKLFFAQAWYMNTLRVLSSPTGWQLESFVDAPDTLDGQFFYFGVAMSEGSSLAAARNDDGHLEVFAISSGHELFHTWQDASSGSGWSAWSSMGGWSDQIAVSQNRSGRLEVFARGSDQALYHRWQGDDGWADWARLGNTIKTFVVAPNANGPLEVFAITADNSLSHMWQDPSANGGWSPWASLGGWSDMLAVDRNADGRLEVFARGSDEALYHIWQDPSMEFGWSGWAQVAGPIDDGALTCPVVFQAKS